MKNKPGRTWVQVELVDAEDRSVRKAALAAKMTVPAFLRLAARAALMPEAAEAYRERYEAALETRRAALTVQRPKWTDVDIWKEAARQVEHAELDRLVRKSSPGAPESPSPVQAPE